MSVTAHSSEPTASGVFTAVQRSVSRNEFFAGLYILACANGLLGRTNPIHHVRQLDGRSLRVSISM